MNNNNIIEYFPLDKPRDKQVLMINAIEKFLRLKRKNIIVEAPVGAGKSAINVSIARWAAGHGGTHLLTPRKSLQDQYIEDFAAHLYPMKGSSNYPCTYGEEHFSQQLSCGADAVCRSVERPAIIKRGCLGPPESPYPVEKVGCPYKKALLEANMHPSVLHNFYSFLYQTMPNIGYFDKRELMIVDEAHGMEKSIIEMIKSNLDLSEEFYQAYLTRQAFFDAAETLEPFLDLAKTFLDRYSERVSHNSKGVPQPSPRTMYVNMLDKLSFLVEAVPLFCFEFDETDEAVHAGPGRVPSRKLTITPLTVARATNRKLFDFAEQRIFSSGTIYNKQMFCSIYGLDPGETELLQMSSEFPVKNRPVVFPSDLMVDTSAANWGNVVEQLTDSLVQILNKHLDQKGLIHVGSYAEGYELATLLKKTGRILTHDKSDFLQKLQYFYASKKPLVFISPNCEEGVDMKYDKARFQVITKVPNVYIGDKYVSKRMKAVPGWYNYNSLIRFGQQLGRVVRAPDDFGVTYLLDSRFLRFIRTNSAHLKKWVTDSFVFTNSI